MTVASFEKLQSVFLDTVLLLTDLSSYGSSFIISVNKMNDSVILVYEFLFTILPKYNNAETAYNTTIFLLNSSISNGKFYNTMTNKSNAIEPFKYSVLNVTEVSEYKLQDINLLISEPNKSSEFSLMIIVLILLLTTLLFVFPFIGCWVMRLKYNTNDRAWRRWDMARVHSSNHPTLTHHQHVNGYFVNENNVTIVAEDEEVMIFTENEIDNITNESYMINLSNPPELNNELIYVTDLNTVDLD